MITKGLITQRANADRLPAQTVERDYVLSHICADVGAVGDPRLVFKGGTLLRLCYFEDYRYSADLDFSSVDGLAATEAIAVLRSAVDACRRRIEAPELQVSDTEAGVAWITYVGPLQSRPRRIKVDISDSELVEGHRRLPLRVRWADMPADSGIEGYTLEEVGAEKLRCIAERLQCRDLFDLHELLDGQLMDATDIWPLYVRKAANDALRGRQRTPPREWAAAFDRRMAAYRERWNVELGDYLPDVPRFGDVERRCRRHLGPAITAARALAEGSR